jgi:hypothetical protein
MRNSLAKQLRRKAEQETVGRPKVQTRKLYKRLKAMFKKMNCVQKFETLQFFNKPKPIELTESNSGLSKLF